MQPGGILAVNVAARTNSLLEDLIKDVKKAFSAGDLEDETLWKEKIKVKEKEEENTARGNKSNSSSSRNSSEAGQVEWNSSMVYLLKASDETANTTLLVIKGDVKMKTLPSPSQGSTSTLKAPVGKKKAIRSVAADSSEATCKTNREEIIQEWLAVR